MTTGAFRIFSRRRHSLNKILKDVVTKSQQML
ncbi:MAG: hypothetical protein JWR29_1192, partial [Tardiphaga sp.]|nr:hypothetical protein [Tardiphaga sp.]